MMKLTIILLYIFCWEISGTHTVNNIVNLVEKYICKKKNQKRKVITIDSENGENKMKAMSDWFSNYKHYNFFLTLQSYIPGIITAHSKKPKLFSLIRKIGAN